MKATEVLNRYAKGERNFRGANLRGQNFKGQDLSGADFSEADIRGTNFSDAILKETNFNEARAGLEKHWLLVLIVAMLLLSAIAALVSVYSSIPSNEGTSLFTPISERYRSIRFLTLLWQAGFLFALTILVGFQRALEIGAVIPAIIWSLTKLLGECGVITPDNTVLAIKGGILSGAVVGTWVLAIAGTMSVTGAVFIAAINFDNKLSAFSIASFLTVVGAGLGILAGTLGTNSFEFQKTGSAASGVIIAAILAICIGGRVLAGDAKFSWIWLFAINVVTWGGTSFCGANLTNADFSKAFLRGSKFNQPNKNQTILQGVSWRSTTGLDRARLGNSILANPTVRDLLVTRDGSGKSYVDANLRAANLDGVNLEGADLTWADLSCATLRHANLKNTNLAESLVLHTNFTQATMTGACLEAWNIDSSTVLDEVDCQYVYLLRHQQERRPSSGDFAPGEFTKLFQEVLSTVDLIFRNGVDWKAFVAAFKQVQVENEDTPLEIQSIENKGDGVVVVRVSVPPETNKEKIHSEFNQQYDLALKALEARYRAELQAREGEIARYREDNANMWEVIKLQANKPIHIDVKAESKSMHNSTDSSQTVNIGGNVSGSTINLGTITGAVTNTINQLPDRPATDGLNLKQLLTELKDAIATEPDLPDTDKADLLEEVKNLAVAQQTEEPAKKEGLVRRSKKIFDATVTTLPDTAKLAEACSKLFPLILKVLGFPV